MGDRAERRRQRGQELDGARVARASPRPFLHVSMDAFIAMLPERMMGHPDGMVFALGRGGDRPCIEVRTGPVMVRAMRGMRHAVAAMAAQGNDLIVDDVFFDPAEAEEYRALLAATELRLVGLFAPLDVLELRERQRGDRAIGLARGQFDRVHRGIAYDLEIDAARADPTKRPILIRDAFGLADGGMDGKPSPIAP